MKQIILVLLLIPLYYSCLSETPLEVNQPDHTGYFPLIDSSYYKYEVTQTDSNDIVTNSLRTVRFKGNTTLNSTTYKIQIDSLVNEGASTTGISFLRKTDTGIFYFADTTGFIDFFPDSLRSNIELQTEIRTQLFPLLPGSQWTVYRISVKILDFLNYNVVNITGRYVEDEEMVMNINGETSSLSTKKVEYRYELRIDTSGDPIVFISNIWLAEDIGIVKMEGSAVLLSIFGGGLLLSTDTSISATQILVQYNLD